MPEFPLVQPRDAKCELYSIAPGDAVRDPRTLASDRRKRGRQLFDFLTLEILAAILLFFVFAFLIALNPDLANADLNTLTARVLDDFRTFLGARGEPTFRAFQLWPRAIPQYTLSHGRFREIMDDVERRNPGLALAGSFREGVALGEVLASADAGAVRLAAYLGEGQSADGT